MSGFSTATLCVLLLLMSSVHGQGLVLEFNGQMLDTNSLLDSAILNETTPITCTTPLTPCCVEGAWRLPNGSIVPEGVSNDTLYTIRANQSISLHLPSGLFEPPSGLYSCELPNQDNVTETVYVGVYETEVSSNNGSLTIDSLHYDAPSQTLICRTSGGPATVVTWRKDNVDITTMDRFETSQSILNAQSAEYDNMLTIVNKTADDSGRYMCMVSNRQGSRSSSLELELCDEGSLRLQGSSFDVVTQTCVQDIWQNVVTNNAVTTDGANLDVELQVTDTAITVQWTNTDMLSMFEVQCSYTTGTLTASQSVFEQTEREVTLTGLQSDTSYTCCVRPLANSSGFVYIYTGADCETVVTRPSPVLSYLEIGLVVAAAALLLLLCLVAVVCSCVLCVCSHRQNRYQVDMKEQSKHYKKQGIKKLTNTAKQPAADTINLKEVGNVYFNNNADLDSSQQIIVQVPQRSSSAASNQQAPTNTQIHTLAFRTPSNSSATKPKRPPKPTPAATKPQISPKPTQPVPQETAEQPIYEEPNVSPSHQAKEEASNPMYGVTSHDQDEAANPMYGVTSHDEEDEADNPLYGIVQ